MGAARPPREADQGAASVGIPVRRAEPDEGGHHVDAAGIGHRLGERLGLRGLGDDAEPVAEPLDGRPRDEDAALERIGDAIAERPGHRGEETMGGGHPPRAGIDEEEAAGPVGVLGRARLQAVLAEQRGLLITRDPRDRDARGEKTAACRLAEDPRRRAHLGQECHRHAEHGGQLAVPGELLDVEAERARGVGGLGGMDPAAGEPPEEPGVHRAEGQLTTFCPRAGPTDVVEQPADLGPGEVGVEDEAGLSPEERLEPVRLHAVAHLRGAPALPDDGVVDGPAGGALPHHRRLSLIGDADGGDLGPVDPGGAKRLAGGILHGGPDPLGVVLDPARPGEMLRQLGIPARAHRALGIHHEGGGARGALVQREDEAAGRAHRGLTGPARSWPGRAGR